MRTWEYAEVTWSTRWSVPGEGANVEDDEHEGQVEFSAEERDTIRFGTGEFWAVVHRLGQQGWEMVGTHETQRNSASSGRTTTYYMFKRPVVTQ